MLTREQLLNPTVKTKEVTLADGNTVYVRKWKGEDVTKMLALSDAHKRKNGAITVMISLCDADGNLMFKDNEVDTVNKMDSATIAAIVDAANEFNSLNLDNAKKN